MKVSLSTGPHRSISFQNTFQYHSAGRCITFDMFEKRSCNTGFDTLRCYLTTLVVSLHQCEVYFILFIGYRWFIEYMYQNITNSRIFRLFLVFCSGEKKEKL